MSITSSAIQTSIENFNAALKKRQWKTPDTKNLKQSFKDKYGIGLPDPPIRDAFQSSKAESDFKILEERVTHRQDLAGKNEIYLNKLGGPNMKLVWELLNPDKLKYFVPSFKDSLKKRREKALKEIQLSSSEMKPDEILQMEKDLNSKGIEAHLPTDKEKAKILEEIILSHLEQGFDLSGYVVWTSRQVDSYLMSRGIVGTHFFPITLQKTNFNLTKKEEAKASEKRRERLGSVLKKTDGKQRLSVTRDNNSLEGDFIHETGHYLHYKNINITIHNLIEDVNESISLLLSKDTKIQQKDYEVKQQKSWDDGLIVLAKKLFGVENIFEEFEKESKKISRYARVSLFEFVAEVHTAIQLGETIPKSVFELYKKLGGPIPKKNKEIKLSE